MNSFYNRNSRNRSRNTKSYSISNVNGYVNPVGTNVPIIAKISTDKSKDNKNKSTRGNNKVVNHSNPLNISTKVLSKDEFDKIYNKLPNKSNKPSKDTSIKIDVTKGNNDRLNKVFKLKDKYYYTDDKGNHHLLKDYDHNSNLQKVANTEISDKPSIIANRAEAEKIRLSQNKNRDDLTQTNRVTGDRRINPRARKNLMDEGYSLEETQDILGDISRNIEQEKFAEAVNKKVHQQGKQEKADGVIDNVDSLVDNFFNGFQDSLYSVRTGINQVGNMIASPFLSDEQKEYNELVARRLKAEQEAETVNKYERNDGALGLVQDAANGLGGIAPSILSAPVSGGSLIPNLLLGLGSFGSAFNQAIDDTDDFNKARLYGAANAGTELLTEKLFGNIPGLGKGFLDDALKKVKGNGLGRVLTDMAGEGAEEYASTVIDEFLKDIYQGNEGKGSFIERLAGVQPEALNSAAVGGLIGGLVNTPGYISDAVNKRKQRNTSVSNIDTNTNVEQQANTDVATQQTEAEIAEEQEAKTYDEQQMKDFVEGKSDIVDEEVATEEDVDVAEDVMDDVLDEGANIDNKQFFDNMPQNPKISIDDEGVAKLNQKSEDYTGVKENDPVRQEHINKYGAIRPESKYKVEKSTDGKNRVHQTIDTLVNSKIFKDHSDIIKSVRDDVTYKDKGTYTPKSVTQAMETARDFIDGYDSMGDAIDSIINNDRTFTDKIEESNLKADDKLNIYGTLLEDLVAMKNATQNDKGMQSYLNNKITDCIPLFNEIANQSGRALRYIQAIKNTVPEYSYANAQVKMIQRFINRQNSILKGKGKEFILPTEVQEMIDNPERIHYTEEQWQNIFRLVGNEAAKQAPKSLFDRLRSIRYLSMLMNPRTWVRNVAGNGVNYGFNGVSDVVRWAIENSVSKFDKDGKYFYTVNKGNAFHVDKALSDLIKANITKLNHNYGVKVEENALDFHKNKNLASKGIGKVLDTAQRINEYALDKPDVFFSQKKYVSSLAQVLERNGINADLLEYMMTNPLDHAEIDLNGTTYTLADLRGKRAILDKALKFAERRAQEITYRQDNSFDKWLKKAMNDESFALRTFARGINVVFPFTKTPFNIGAEMIKDSPLGLAQGAWELRNALKTGGDINHAIETMSKGLTGTGVMLLGMFLHNSGFLTGDGNDMDEKEKEFAMQRGWKPFSFRYDGDGSTVFADISALTPMSMSLALGAVIDEMTCNYKTFSEIGPNGEANDRVDYVQTLKDFAIAMAEPWANMSALSGISNTLPQYTDSEGDFLVEFIYNTGKNYVSQFIPQVLKQINRTFFDPKIHTTQGMGNATDKFISGLSKDSLLTSKNNNVAIDYRGNQKEYFDGFFGLDGMAGRAMNNFINPFTMSEMKHDPVADELARLYKDTGESSVIPSNSYVKQYTDKGTKYEVTRDDWQEINEDKRKTFMTYVDEFVNSKEYQNMDDKERVEVIDRLKKLTTESNKSKLLENKGVDYDSSSLAKVAAGEKQGLKAYQTVLLNPDKEAIISTESTADLLVNLSDNGFSEQQARDYLASVGDEISENDEKIIKGMFQQSETYNQIMDEFTRDIPNDVDDYEYERMYKKAGKELATCLGEYQQLMEGADIKATDYQRLVRAMDNGVSPYEYLTIASHNSMKEEILYMRDTLGRSADEIMWFEQNIMKRANNKLNEAWEVLNN